MVYCTTVQRAARDTARAPTPVGLAPWRPPWRGLAAAARRGRDLVADKWGQH